ncbi:MAG: ExeM/NucH family extracellular endonuclease [Propionicimonas sp.]
MRRLLLATLATTLLTSGLAAAAPAYAAPAGPVFISELHYDNAGADVDEAVEVFGPAGTDLTGWSIVLYNGSGGASYGTLPLTGQIPDLAGGYGVVVAPAAGLQNGAPDGLALVDAGGAVVEFLSYEGTFTASNGPAAGLASTDIGVNQPGTGPVGFSLQLAGCLADPQWQPESANTFGTVAPLDTSADCDSGEEPEEPEPAILPISAVQGSGATSPRVGQVVTVEGIVVGDQEGASPAMRGFFLQEEDADTDEDATTSEGIFVFNGSANTVSVGDQVRVTGTVTEFDGLTELTQTTVTVLGSGKPLPTPASVSFPVDEVSDLEAYEGMLATFPQQLVIAEYFNFDRYGEIVVALPAAGEDFPMSPTALFDPASPQAAARNDLNLRSRITVDDGISAQNVATNHPITGEPLTIDTMFRGGDTVAGLTGPVFQAFNLYRVLAYDYDDYQRTTASPTPDEVGGRVTAAWLNALNYFTTIGATCSPTRDEDCRGADDPGELQRQRTKLLNTLEGLGADVVGLGELENTPGVEVLDDIVTGLNERLGDGTYAYVEAGTDGVVGPDVIKVGIIYRPEVLTPVGETAVLDSPDFLDPNHTGEDRNRAAVAQSFRENATGEVFSVTANHFKSKGSACGEQGEGGLVGNCDLTRTLTAKALAAWLASDPTGINDDDWLILGDLNAYDHEAPIVALTDAGYADLAREYHGDYAHSYVFDGQAGYLDYALSSTSLTRQVTGVGHWNINANEPDIIDYDTSFKSAGQAALFDPTTPYRSSDHDPVLVGLKLKSKLKVTASPNVLLLPTHLLHQIKLTAKGERKVSYQVEALAGTSSEADSGLGRYDQPRDIVIENGKLRLRAERYSRQGRTYTVEVLAAGGGQARFDTVTVKVPYLFLIPQLG